jgi:hypothetical protein
LVATSNSIIAQCCTCRKSGHIGDAFRLGLGNKECARCTSPSRSHRRLRVPVCAKRARTAGVPQRFARCVAMWCDALRRVVERCDAQTCVALPTVMSISPTRLIGYPNTWRGREATSRQRCCHIVSVRQRQPTRRARLPQGHLDKQRNQPSHPALSSLFQGGPALDRDAPEHAADRHARAAVMASFAVI